MNFPSEATELGCPIDSSFENGSFQSHNVELEAKNRLLLVQWLSSLIPSLKFPPNVTDGELRACLSNGTVLCQILNKLRPGIVNVVSEPDNVLPSQSENVKSFLKVLDLTGLLRFEISDLEKGSMKAVVECLLTLRKKSLQHGFGDNLPSSITVSPRVNSPFHHHHCSTTFGGEQKKFSISSKLQRVMSSPSVQEQSASLIHHAGHNFHEVFQLKPGSYIDLPPEKISEMMKSNNIDNAPTQSLLSVVNGILEESVERRNGEIPHRVACLLRKVAQEIERRMSTQAEHLRTQNNLFKAREEKYQSRIRVLETLASETKDENERERIKDEENKVDETEVGRLIKEQQDKILEISALKIELETAKRTSIVQFARLEAEAEGAKAELTHMVQEYKQQIEEVRNKAENMKDELVRLMKEQEDKRMEISALKSELGTAKRTYEAQFSQLEEEAKGAKAWTEKAQEYEYQLKVLQNKVEKFQEEVKTANDEEIARSMKEREHKDSEILALKQALETTKTAFEVQRSQLEKDVKSELEQKCEEYEHQLKELRNKVKELEVSSDSKDQKWNMKMNRFLTVITFQFSSLQKMKLSLESTKQNVIKEQTVYAGELDLLGVKLKPLLQAAENYHVVMAENKKLFNEIQELKGNIRVYCRIRPSALGKLEKESIVEHVGENDLVVANPSKEGKDTLRSFKFNRVFNPAATQAEVYSDIQDFTRSVLDGYNVCIFAYGQTGSGKTYTMTGPNGATSETIGVNYRALNDLFRISTSRQNIVEYEIGVQMVEIYNEQVRDLLTTYASPKRLGILTQSRPNGLVVPDASLFPVKLPSDVIKLMEIGLKNRAIAATAMNERSSRSHSVVSVHVTGKDLKTGCTMAGNLHLVDLAGSERVDRSEVIGDRLKEAQHINRSLAALGDVIFSLSQKSSHVPYRNSKLTQLLQTSLGGQAKTLMFVQINSDVSSYSETLSTLKFAERVSGVELGAARSNKEGKDFREMIEQVSSLKSSILAKDEEIERLQAMKGLAGSRVKRNIIPRSRSSIQLQSASPQPIDDHAQQNDFVATAETSGCTDSDFDGRSSDFSDGGVAAGTETDGSENSSLTEVPKPPSEKMSKGLRRTVQAMRKFGRTSSNTIPTIPTAAPVKEPVKKSSSVYTHTTLTLFLTSMLIQLFNFVSQI
ncbi:kinesin-like protein KIN-14D [Vigna angularis]|uniref:kinesin-like protein KIN-14D n=1 Tax=Phaseolus angularis TaxID=3914 RepID=UPI0022B2F457|nr:kinesin-like protein KIN-14D [Vigna angularis]